MLHSDHRSTDFSFFFTDILTILNENPDGIKEFELIQNLSGRGLSQFDHERYIDNLGLFQTHFLLFHTLYLLKDELIRTGRGTLHIHCLEIRLEGPVGGEDLQSSNQSEKVGVEVHDPLRAYYLDLEHLAKTGESEVEDMLKDFWKRYQGYDKLDSALGVLGLDRQAGADEIQKRYRTLAMELHPDRGGDGERILELNAAMEVLQDHFGL